MRSLRPKQLKELRKIYKPIKTIMDHEKLINSNHQYNGQYISVFDHWLSEEEADNQIFCYQHALEESSTIGSKQYYEYHDQLLKFYLDLYKQTIVYGICGMFTEGYEGLVNGVVFDSIEEYKWHVLASIREQFFLRIALPEFSAIIGGSHDLTHLLYTLKTKPEGFNNISSIIKSHGLFILN